MPRPNHMSDDRNPKRRQLNDGTSVEAQPYLNDLSGLSLKQHECAHSPVQDEEQKILSSHNVGDIIPSDETCIGDEWSECCYGMLSGIQLQLRQSPGGVGTLNVHNLPVTFRTPNILSSQDDIPIELEVKAATHSRILCELNDLEGIKVQLCCYSRLELPPHTPSHTHKRRNGKAIHVWRLNVIIYGTMALAEIVGRHLSKYRMYLQDPIDCERTVLYKNPHMISHGEDGVMTDFFTSIQPKFEIERLSVGPDLLAQLMAEQTPLPETEPPSIVTTSLFRYISPCTIFKLVSNEQLSHQKQALTFMIRREQGWDMEGTQDIWTRRESHQGYHYHNNVSGSIQHDPPPNFRGGLLADDMGLGKTLSMISLISANQFVTTTSPYSAMSESGNISCPRIKSTLLVVPPPLIQAWKKQFSMHVRPDRIKLHIYHGQNRKDIDCLLQHDVVITTYQTLSSIWKKHESHSNPQHLFSVVWHRVILDEAHAIQNSQSQLARACCALQAERRWAITGTPIQNKLTDFASVVKFLQVHPYSDQRNFDEEISRPWHQVDPDGFLRLKTLVRAITISRTKSVINLPPRVDEIHHLEFSSEESVAYESANKETIALFEEAISSGRQGGKTFNALSRLNFLRLFCNLGLLVNFRQACRPSSASRTNVYSSNHEDRPNSFLGEILDGSTTCGQCGQALLEDLLEGLSDSTFDQSPSMREAAKVCNKCRSESAPNQLSHPPREQSAAALSGLSTPDEDDRNLAVTETIPTKIKAVVADIFKHSPKDKCVVFSFWTSTLDIVQQTLQDEGILCTRIDGKTSLAKRSEAMNSFQTNDSISVILVSITCGGAGLDLTAGSRAYLLEPHWNPMIEEQALCRVHRVGQLRNVTTIRYLMRNSFEEQVVEIQKRKKKLAEVTFGSGELEEAGIGLGTLQYLKSVLE
ncbi:SNF2 family N-terminal domain-containing protein [Rhexocercosporidium sp. MPI-PUGE-AT-0058]|nr:SNF2 family N-terminal domain-containing protein [Rhexocercosporidium sp. MPI-PUGE-AT-0058]